ncbi:MAG TPA: PAS domain S-box protein, partial [Propionicimonas sp.]
VGNAVLHAHTPVELSIEVGVDVRVQVRDFNITLPVQRVYDNRATTGRGLSLVAALSDEHGVTEAGPEGKTVWFRVGGGRPRSDDELLSAWSEADWDLGDLVPARGRAPGVRIRLLELPPTLWLAARQHHDAMLRELALYVARRPVPGVDTAGADTARACLSAGVASLGDAQHLAQDTVGPQGSGLPGRWLPEPVDVELTVPPDVGSAFRAMQDTLDAGEHLARTGQLLVRPGLPEIVAVRRWMCTQVVSQLDGAAPEPWPGPEEGTATADPAAAEPLAWSVPERDVTLVRESPRPAVAADDNNRIVAVSPSLAELTGWSVEDLVGRRIVDLIPPRFREAHVAGFTRHLSTGEAHVLGVPLTLPVLRADGSEVMCSMLIELSHADTGRPLYVAWLQPVEQVTAPLATVDHAALFRSLPTPYLVMDRDLVIVDANDAYLRGVGRTREAIVGRPVFAVFPPTPDALDDEGRPRVQTSLERARDTGVPDTMPIQQYDITDQATGALVRRFWSLISAPVLDAEGRAALVTQRAEDITDFVRQRDALLPVEREHGPAGHRRVEEVEADLFARAQDLAAALASKELTARRLAILAEGASLLTSAQTLEDVERIVVRRGLAALGADGGALLVRRPGGGWRVWASGSREGDRPVAGDAFEADSRGPTVWTARTGQRLLLPTRAAGLAFDPVVMGALYESTQRSGWAFVPLMAAGETLGSLAVAWTEEHQTTRDELELLDALAAQLSQALARIGATEARRAAETEHRGLALAWRESLHPRPADLAGLEVAARYLPGDGPHPMGGRWYDAFVTAAGSSTLVVAEVEPGGFEGATLAAQVRNLLRGISYDTEDGPAGVLQRLEHTMRGLGLDAVVSVLLAIVDPPGAEAAPRTMRWSSAGRFAPLVWRPDAGPELFPDGGRPLLGGRPRVRREQTTVLDHGSAVLLCTGGEEDRQGLRGLGEPTPDGLADLAVEHLRHAEGQERDLAVLVARTT